MVFRQVKHWIRQKAEDRKEARRKGEIGQVTCVLTTPNKEVIVNNDKLKTSGATTIIKNSTTNETVTTKLGEFRSKKKKSKKSKKFDKYAPPALEVSFSVSKDDVPSLGSLTSSDSSGTYSSSSSSDSDTTATSSSTTTDSSSFNNKKNDGKKCLGSSSSSTLSTSSSSTSSEASLPSSQQYFYFSQFDPKTQRITLERRIENKSEESDEDDEESWFSFLFKDRVGRQDIYLNNFLCDVKEYLMPNNNKNII